MSKAQAIRRSIVQLKHLQAARKREKQQHADGTRILAFGVCDSIMHTTSSTGSFATKPKFSVRSALSVVLPFVALAMVLLGVMVR